MNSAPLAATVFIASAVEAVEATTIVLAVGATRSWRSATLGLVSALGVLAVLVLVLGPAIAVIPIKALRVIVGGLLLIFGLQWLRKSVLRASGLKALHDETEIYGRELAEAEAAPVQHVGLVSDWYAFTVSFKGVLLEGLEIVFIVLTFGANAHNIPVATAAALAAALVVALVGLAVRAPLARVPENALKFVVGVMLTSFGTFWGAEGVGVAWPGGEVALVALVCGYLVLGLAIIAAFRGGSPAMGDATAPAGGGGAHE